MNVTKICRERRQSHWYKDYRHPYEAIELAKAFGAEESHKFINGALDKAVRTLRKDERD